MKIIIAVLLIVHGLIVASQSSGSFSPTGGLQNPSWLNWWPANLGQSWLLSRLGLERTLFAWGGGLLWLVAGLALVAAGLGVVGIVVPLAWWRSLALWGAVISLVMLAVYLHPFYGIGIGASVVLMASLVWAQWPLLERLGGNTPQIVNRVWWSYLMWIATAALLGVAISGIFANWLRLPRSIFLIPYVILGGLFVYAYWLWSGVSVTDLLRHNWIWGVIGAVLVGLFVIRNILSQPISPHTTGLPLVFDLLWSGIVYGGIDALLLSVLPVLATWQAFSVLGWTGSWPGKILVGVIALLLSLFVTASYHMGFTEYRQPGGILGPTIGNGVMSLGYLLTNNPLAAIFSHIAMHVAGVLHGPASVMQLPPHY